MFSAKTLNTVLTRAMASRQVIFQGLTSADVVKRDQNSKHFGPDDPEPATPAPGRVRLLSMYFCPYAQRTRILLKHKNVPHDVINVNLQHKADWFVARNPIGLVPVIELDGQVAYESDVVAETINKLFPDPPMMATDPFQRARDRMLKHRFDELQPLYKAMIFGRVSPRRVARQRRDWLAFTHELESIVSKQNFFGGDHMNLVDVHLWPFFERFPAIRNLSSIFKGPEDEDGFDILPLVKFPNLSAWIDRMQSIPAVQETVIDIEQHMQYIVSLAQKQPNFHIGLSDQAKL